MFEKIPKIFFVTTIELKGVTKGLPIRDTRTVGWFPTFNLAEYATDNYGDIHETGYQYAVIEEIAFGFYPCPPSREFWYEFDKEKEQYIPINKPKEFEKIVNFSIG
jgi:hypothetical protein